MEGFIFATALDLNMDFVTSNMMLMPKDDAPSFFLGENISINVYPWESKFPMIFSKCQN
jgi:hypothetical protein